MAMMRFMGVAYPTIDTYNCTVTRNSVTAARATWDGPSRCLICVPSAPSSTRPRPAAPISSSPGHQKKASADKFGNRRSHT